MNIIQTVNKELFYSEELGMVSDLGLATHLDERSAAMAIVMGNIIDPDTGESYNEEDLVIREISITLI